MVPSHLTFPGGIVLPLHGTVPTRWGSRRPGAGVWVWVNNHAVRFVGSESDQAERNGYARVLLCWHRGAILPVKKTQAGN